MTKADIIEIIADGTGITKVETEAILDAFIRAVSDTLKSGQSIEIRGFGSFKVKKKNARKARNPRTGEVVEVPAKFSPTFKYSRDFKISVDKGMKGE